MIRFGRGDTLSRQLGRPLFNALINSRHTNFLQFEMLSKYRNSIFAVLAFVILLVLSYLGCFSSTRNVSPEVFTQQALEEVRTRDLKHAADWGLGKEVNWIANHDAGTIAFTFADGTIATAPMQIIGAYNNADGTFRWGWDYPNAKEPLRKHAELARKFGQDNELPSYTTPSRGLYERRSMGVHVYGGKARKRQRCVLGPIPVGGQVAVHDLRRSVAFEVINRC